MNELFLSGRINNSRLFIASDDSVGLGVDFVDGCYPTYQILSQNSDNFTVRGTLSFNINKKEYELQVKTLFLTEGLIATRP